MRKLWIISFIVWMYGLPVFAQESDSLASDPPFSAEEQEFSRSQAPRVFLDCDGCDFSFIRQEMTFVNYVRDPELAQVHVFVTSQRTGSGGQTYTITITGQQNYTGLDNTLSYTSPQGNTWAERRSGLTEMLKIGLVPYIARTPLASRVSILFKEPERMAPVAVDDPWDSWIFDIEANGSFDKEASRSAYSFDGSVSGDRVTEDWKVGIGLRGGYRERNFEQDDEAITSTSHSGSINGRIIKSMTDHWSAGVFGDVSTSTYRNQDLNIGITPALEYNVYPYTESSRKELTLSYRIGYDYRKYIEETIYLKMQESLLGQSLHANVRIRQPWGYVFAGMSGSHYFHDFSKNSIDFYSNISLRVLKGLSVRFTGSFEIIHDQLYLALGDATLEELLLQQRQLATTYELSGSIGFAYTFGSIYNNVVNTRL